MREFLKRTVLSLLDHRTGPPKKGLNQSTETLIGMNTCLTDGKGNTIDSARNATWRIKNSYTKYWSNSRRQSDIEQLYFSSDAFIDYKELNPDVDGRINDADLVQMPEFLNDKLP